MSLMPEPGYLYAFLCEMADKGRLFAQRRNDAFACRVASDLPVAVLADFHYLRQVIFTLLGNAAKFTRDGSILFEVSKIADEAGGARLLFAVTDSGTGCSPGLAAVRQLLRGMGSALKLEPAAGGGSRSSFELVLPRVDENTLDAAFAESLPSCVDGAGRRILLVDDDSADLAWLGELLAGYGFEVMSVPGGREALQALRTGRFDLLLCDQAMPGMDGWKLLRQARAGWPDLPVVLYSAAPLRRPPGAEGLDFDAALLRPAAGDDLLACIDACARPWPGLK
ncbi:hypothetical protein GCM10023144_14110 [Pigmentiphaga soli]|uniref:Response regulatory domain-containing protein n=1 Tax=Pigmentiphaga soli TaxID=1007095 RepID=A0ABP8GQA8_9BURK